MKRSLTCFLIVMLGGLAGMVSGAELSPEAVAWLAAQTNIQTWSADFVQTRKLKSLTQPLKSKGHVWFAAPNKFRWELGHPAQTIAVRAADEMLIFYPQLKRVERYPLTQQQAGPWRDALSLLEAGFPRSRPDLEEHYDILSQNVSGGVGQLVLQPKSAAARRMIPQIEIDFDTHDHSLRATELEFADGSKMRNDFEHPELNPKLNDTMFAPPVPPDYKVVNPLEGH